MRASRRARSRCTVNAGGVGAARCSGCEPQAASASRHEQQRPAHRPLRQPSRRELLLAARLSRRRLERPRVESNHRTELRRLPLCPLSYGAEGSATAYRRAGTASASRTVFRPLSVKTSVLTTTVGHVTASDRARTRPRGRLTSGVRSPEAPQTPPSPPLLQRDGRRTCPLRSARGRRADRADRCPTASSSARPCRRCAPGTTGS